MNANTPLLAVSHLSKRFPVKGRPFSREKRQVHAVDDVSFTIARGEVVGLVGESGSGKTTIGRTIMRLTDPTEGAIVYEGTDIAGLPGREMMAFRRKIQMVFQDPFASLNPRRKVGELIAEGMEIHGIGTRRERMAEVARLLDLVGLPTDAAQRFPHEFSGGQRQRIGIARALAVAPGFIVADEPVSALDVSVQAQVLNLLQDLKDQLGLTILFIAHDLAVVEHFCDRVIVMYLGRIMEIAPRDRLYASPKHPYTEALLSAAPAPDPDRQGNRIVLEGDIPSPINPPSGCVMRTRCRYALPECAQIRPELREVAPGHLKACIRDDIL
ncbi:ABC transporter ATP-binding protein [Pelagibacterium halotolerans]|uniref:Oligopeptide transport ATP-binding protein OppF n=1 Tax=Pelagibacterium halotolerans (strain DSM 22347 / JCM 15775 / CGMCC 1.7692 / B2) TaxID=1082931 RepID=G4R7A4_PELHB|nr:ABC transporter ATP-binding protein [Pelagibacterium halotolerans]AEQ51240.1 oligopeptide transport ATP-binding protein OppF [Pelagibacterium halotolerans B2]QJR18898.1 ABC transporter ATP-binding protein [Pelagibacterium halotolerans]SEA67567.1 peptide/nickel transport system ATP-binding protein/oligopeptide transport system ATP-binding protein [Pelagibacterium halotolerans]